MTGLNQVLKVQLIRNSRQEANKTYAKCQGKRLSGHFLYTHFIYKKLVFIKNSVYLCKR